MEMVGDKRNEKSRHDWEEEMRLKEKEKENEMS